MTQTTGIVTVDDWINCHDVISIWIIEMSFKSDVVKIREAFVKFVFVLTLLDDVLFFKPMPLSVDFTEVFDHERIVSDSIFVLAENS